MEGLAPFSSIWKVKYDLEFTDLGTCEARQRLALSCEALLSTLHYNCHTHVHISVCVYTPCMDVYDGHLCACVSTQRYLYTYVDVHVDIHISSSVYTLQWVLISWFLLTFMILYVSGFLESLNNFIISETFILLIF